MWRWDYHIGVISIGGMLLARFLGLWLQPTGADRDAVNEWRAFNLLCHRCDKCPAGFHALGMGNSHVPP
jgi:hypothetical protein